VTQRRLWPLIVLSVSAALLLTVGVVYVLFRIRVILLPFALGAVVAYVFEPLLDSLESRGWKRTRAVWFVVLCLVAAGVIVAALIVPPAVSQAQQLASNLGSYIEELSLTRREVARIIAIGVNGKGVEYAVKGTPVEVVLSSTPFRAGEDGVQGDIGQIVSPNGKMTVSSVRRLQDGTVGHVGVVEEGWLGRRDKVIASVDLMRRFSSRIAHWAEQTLGITVTTEKLGEVEDRARNWLGGVATRAIQYATNQVVAILSNVAMIIIVPIITFYLMLELKPIGRRLYEMVPEDRRQEALAVSREISTMLGGYLRGIAIVSISIGIASALLLYVLHFVFGMDYALLLGIVTGLLYPIPYIGATLSAVLAGVVGYATASTHSLLCGLLAAGLMIACNQVFDNILMPRIVGKRVGLHPLAVLFALMAGYALWGIIGMIAAVPVTGSLKIILWHAVPQLAGRTEKKQESEADDAQDAAMTSTEADAGMD